MKRSVGEMGGVKMRLPYLDYARVLVAFLVVFGHLLYNDDMSVRPYIYAFHMPFFFMVSGMLHKDLGTVPLAKYVRTLVVPFVTFNLFFLLLRPLCIWLGIWDIPDYVPQNVVTEDTSLGQLYGYVFVGSLKSALLGTRFPDGPTWFLLALLWCKVLTDVINRRPRLLLPIVAMAVVLVMFRHYKYLCIGRALMVMPFFYGGFYFKRQIQTWLEKRWVLAVGIGLVLLNIPLTLLNGRVSTDGIFYGHLSPFPLNVLVFYFNAFACSLGLLAICMQFRQRRIVTIAANALITILCAQNLFCYTYRHLGNRDSIVVCLMASVLITVACVLIHQLLERYVPFAVGKQSNRNK